MKIKIRTVLFVLIICSILSCKSNKENKFPETTETSDNLQEVIHNIPKWAEKSAIYEVNIRNFSNAGDINTFSDHIPRIKDLGFDIIRLNSILPISRKGRIGEIGNIYAISNFDNIDPSIGNNQDLKNLIDKIHAYKMKIILDWHPAYSGQDHPWIKEKKEYYLSESQGQPITPSYHDYGNPDEWKDVYSLNYQNPELGKEMIEILVNWMKTFELDGYFFNQACQVPSSFWNLCLDVLNQTNPEALFVAHCDDISHNINPKFNLILTEKSLDQLDQIYLDKAQALDYLNMTDSMNNRLIHHTSSTYSNAWRGSTQHRFGAKHLTPLVAGMILPGITMIQGGQEIPIARTYTINRHDPFEFGEMFSTHFFKTILPFIEANPALWNGTYGGDAAYFSNNPNVIAVKRKYEGNEVTLVMNLSGQDQKVTFSSTLEGDKDLFDQTSFTYNEGETYILAPWKFNLSAKTINK